MNSWEEVKIDPDHEQRWTLTLTTVEIRGKKYGSCPTIISLGGGPPIEATAVVCGPQKWVSTKEDALAHLVEWGLTEEEARLLIMLGEAVDKARVPSLAEQEEQGQYEEEVQKIADGVLEDVRAGAIKRRAAARSQLAEAAEASNYGRDQLLAAAALRHARNHKNGVLALARSVLVADCLPRLISDPAYEKLP